MKEPPDIKPNSHLSCAPLSCFQEQLWFLARLFPDVPIYNDSITIHIDEEIDSNLLERSLRMVIDRHEILRTNFAEADGRPIQMVTHEPHFAMPFIDLRSLPDELREKEANQLATEKCRQIFDLAAELPVRATLIRLGERRFKLFVTFHHIVYDGRSLTVFFQELAEVYAGLSAGYPPRLPPLYVQYADFACWQQEWVRDREVTSQLGYWQRQFAGELPFSELPTDHAIPVTQSFRGAKKAIRVPAGLSLELNMLARREGATLYAVLLSTYLILLQRYSGQDDLIVGSTTRDRKNKATAPLVGYFTNTLALRFDLADLTSFRQLLDRVQSVIVGANNHSDLPFIHLVNAINPQRQLSRTPLFQNYFNLEPPLTAHVTNWSMSFMDLDSGSARFEFSLILQNWSDTIAGCFEYSTELFDSDRVDRMTAHFLCLLNGIVEDPKRSPYQLPMLSLEEEYNLKVNWNRTGVDCVDDVCVHRLFERQARATPDAIAVELQEQTLTYRELNDRANDLASYLCSLGIGPECLVAICIERSLEMIVGLLGILKSGGGYIPLDPDYPKERLHFVIQDARVSVVLTQSRIAELFVGRDIAVICLDSRLPRIVAIDFRGDHERGVTPNHLAYAIYTSGSTGYPKGVLISHRALGNHMQWMQHTFPLRAGDRVLQKTPFVFDASVWEFFAPLLAGARLVIARPGGHQDIAYLIDTIVDRDITILQMVPSLLGPLVNDPRFGNCRSLRRVFSGGEPLTPELRDRFQRSVNAELVNLYGPTEATIDATYYSVGSDRCNPVPIGRPIANTQIYILDRHLQPVPIGVAGELHIGGTGLARGYLNRPDLTSEKFIPNPFENVAGGRLYKTGDRACYRSDGNIEYLGRMDQQVKIRGFRVELGEIEHALSEHPWVRNVAVGVHQTVNHGSLLTAYVVCDPTSTPEVGELRQFLGRKLPDYMLPGAMVFLDSLPLNHHGKLDRGALPIPDAAQAATDATYVPPRNALEAAFARIWEETLGVEPVGIQDNFFELGGHSLMAIQIISRIRQKLSVEVPLSALFARPTVERLAEADWPKCGPPHRIARTRRK